MEHHLPALISDLAVILMAASVVSLLFKKLNQPVVLGYIIAGFLVGPHISFFPTVLDLESLKTWSEIGVIFLLFALGLEFSFRKLARVGGAASITALVEVVAMLAIGWGAGRLFGWSQMDAIFLGGILAISSTTIIIRAFEEAGVKGRRFVNLVFGVLIVEDLVAILLLVLLSTLAISKQFSGSEMVGSVVKLLFFLTLWFLSGIFLVPSVLRRLKSIINEESLLVVSIGLCFLMVALASKAGFSPALGAFIMGSILAETTDAEKIEHLVKPVKDLFAAIFFVSVGTLIDPKALSENAAPVLILTVVTIAGKILSTTFGALVSGQPLRRSLQSGFSVAQIGEFSFIIAGLGLSLKVTSGFLYPIAVGVSALTTFTTPYLIRWADPAANALVGVLPARWVSALDAYSSAAQSAAATAEWSSIIRGYASRILLNAVLVTAIFIAAAELMPPFLSGYLESAKLVRGLSLFIAVMASAPFLWAWLLSLPARNEVRHLWRTPRYRVPLLALEFSRISSAIVLFGFLAPKLVTNRTAFLITIASTLVVLVAFSRYWRALYKWFANRFVTNLEARESAAEPAVPPIAPWDAHIARFEVAPNSEIAGQTLMDIGIRENFGVTVALIERGSRVITAPMRNERLFPFDRLSVIGTDEQIALFRTAVEASVLDGNNGVNANNFALQRVSVPAASNFCQRSIRESGIRETTKGLVVGLERAGTRILNPDSSMTIEPDDILWIVGDRRLIREVF